MKKHVRLSVLLLLIALVLSLSATALAAWPDPSQTFTIVAGYNPGGGTDTICRKIAPFLEKYLGIPVVVQNIPGAGGLVGHNTVFAGRADGYTCIYTATTDGIWSYYNLQDVPWKLEDWKSTGVIASMSTQGFVCMKEKPWQDFGDLIEEMRANPDMTVNLGTMGPSRIEDTWVIEIMEKLGVKFNWIFYDSSSSVQTDLLTGDLDLAIMACTRNDFIDHPNFRVLTVVTPELPEDCPYAELYHTMSDFQERLGYSLADLPALSMVPVVTFIVKANIPDEAYTALCDAFKKMAEDPEYQEAIKSNSWPTYISPEDAQPIFDSINSAFASYVELQKQYVK